MLSGPPPIRAAPIKPPINACEELVGTARYHARTFQAIAAETATRMTCGDTMRGSTMPVPTILATAVPSR